MFFIILWLSKGVLPAHRSLACTCNHIYMHQPPSEGVYLYSNAERFGEDDVFFSMSSTHMKGNMQWVPSDAQREDKIPPCSSSACSPVQVFTLLHRIFTR